MTYNSSKWININSKGNLAFSGGYVDNTPSFTLAENASPYLRNARLDGQATIIRPGHDLFATLTTGDYPKGISGFFYNDYTPAFLKGGPSTTVIGTWNSVTNGGFIISFEGTSYGITGLDFSSDTDLNDVAATIQTGIRAATGGLETCTYTASGSFYTISSADTTTVSEISFASTGAGTDISGAGGSPRYLWANSANGTITRKAADTRYSSLVVRHNQDTTEKLVSMDSAGTVTSIDTGTNITSDNRMSFINAGDLLYCMNGEDDLGTFDGFNYSTPNTGIDNFSPDFGTVFNSSFWVSGWGDNPNIVYKSVGDDFSDFDSSGSDSFSFEEKITGLITNNRDLFIFTANTISSIGTTDIQETSGTLTYITRSLGTKEGAVNNASIVTAGTNLFYVTPSNSIMRLYKGANLEGYESMDLSDRAYAGIDTIMATLDEDQSDCFGYYLPKESLIKWFFKSEGATFNDVCIIYDITKDAFLVDSDKFFYDGAVYDGNNYTVSMIESKVYQDEFGQDDEDTGIDFEYRTKEYTLGDPSYKKWLWEARTVVDINELAELTQEIYVGGVLVDTKTIDKDNIDTQQIGIGTQSIGTNAIGTGGEEGDELQEVIILRTKGNLNVKGTTIQYRYTCNTLAAKARLKNLSHKVEVLNELTTNLTT